MTNFLWLLLAFGLVLLNAFFVAAEFSIVKLRYTRIQAIKGKYGFRGRILEYIHTNLDAYLSACQLGITLASLGLGWVGEPVFASLFAPVFYFLGIDSAEVVRIISFFAAFSILSFLHIVIGELMPKSLAIRQAEAVSVWTAVPLYGFYWMMYPAIWVLNSCSNFLLKQTGLDSTHDQERYCSTEEIKLILSMSHLHGELTRDEAEILEHTLEFADLEVTDLMRPYNEIVMLDIQKPINQLLEIVLEHRYSRYPVYDSKQKKIIGTIHIKDLFAELYKQKEISSLDSFVRPVLIVPDHLAALELLKKFREGMSHFALVYKGADTLLGFITLDNLLHILLGRIKDEFHKTQDDWVKNPDGTLTVKGECSLYSLERAIEHEITIEEDEDNVETLAALIVARAGVLPKEGVIVHFKEFDATIEKVQGPHIRKIKLNLKI